MTVTIYRVENENQVGPYRADWDRNFKSEPYIMKKHPAPEHDGVTVTSERVKFGFASLDQLLDWFDLWIPNLRANNFRVVKLDIAPELVQYGRKQVVFEDTGIARVIVSWDELGE